MYDKRATKQLLQPKYLFRITQKQSHEVWNSNVVITDLKGKVVLNFDLEKNAHSILF